ncbi:hypothetical protein SAMN04487765_3469 [Tenacibaculum sp. MAR_2010_89]|uniref:tetratricopeptide repeat-containing sensor histidine kinase n=1 Tax=Tenacibaculum sp. MAR_2010_89 TaxID=1250198 RepID=UPI00089B1AF5|nr:sensor histidine kinase [Tenacibaculum sp. MAR_2010_89]SEE62938.1 hypothetical protein SAMN04487765_3469 [Tenacibaculum sp. MAR_2010_89]
MSKNLLKYFINTVIAFFAISVFSINQIKKDSSYIYFTEGIKSIKLNKADLAYKYILKSKELYLTRKKIDSVFICNIELYDIVKSQKKLNKDPLQYLKENQQYKITDTVWVIALKNRFASYFFNQNSPITSAKYYKESLKLCFKINRKDYAQNTYTNLGLLYSIKKPDSASYFLNKALNTTSVNNPDKLIGIYINLINLYQKQKNYRKAIEILEKTKNLKLSQYEVKYQKIIYQKLADCYQQIGNYQRAYKYQQNYILYKDSLNTSQQNIAIANLDKKYKVTEKEKENLQLKQDNLINEQQIKHGKNLFYGALAFLILGGIIGFLTLKNSRRKRLLAEQQNQLEQQKNLTLLKEQELNTINAMIEGQEKERIRIAEDLHDNIGSVLATLKLHFENLQLNREKKHFNQEKLYKKTEKLIDETYLKIRSIAHAKNSGVIANKGLLVAVKIMAEKISDANKISIDVIDYGLNKRLENSLEITVFRIIQELTTNIIKHSKATHASINISQFENTLNIIVEDNGKGFDYNKIAINKGMGIGSIQTRIKHLNGTFEIDSTKNKGTSIIIDIPINNT